MYGVNLVGSYVLEAVDSYALGLELPLLYSDLPGKTRRFGLGDFTINNTFIPWRKEDLAGWCNAAGILCPVALPTGEFDAGLGTGNRQLIPAILLSFKLGPVRAFPILGYQFSVAGSGQAGRDRAPLSQGPTMDVVLAGPLPDPWYTAITPHYFYDRSAAADEQSFTLKLQVGRMFGKRLNQAIEVEVVQELLQRAGAQTVGRLSYTFFD